MEAGNFDSMHPWQKLDFTENPLSLFPPPSPLSQPPIKEENRRGKERISVVICLYLDKLFASQPLKEIMTVVRQRGEDISPAPLGKC